MSDAGNWCLIESDPGVFTELIHKFGVTGLQVEELWSLDKENFAELKPVHGLVFLFKWTPDNDPAGSVVQVGQLCISQLNSVFQDSRLESIFFARQVINNACATQAIMSVLMNIEDSGVTLGTTLQEFKEFCGALDAETKGLALSNSDQIRSVHNSFARQTLFEFDSKKADKDDDVFHFVSFVPINGRIYELDGLKAGPVDHGPAGEDWTDAVRPVIEARMMKYTQGEIHFNLMAVIQDKTIRSVSGQSVLYNDVTVSLVRYNNQLKALSGMSIDSQMAEVARIEMLLAEEENKRSKWKLENVRRRHNYLPLIMELLR